MDDGSRVGTASRTLLKKHNLMRLIDNGIVKFGERQLSRMSMGCFGSQAAVCT